VFASAGLKKEVAWITKRLSAISQTTAVTVHANSDDAEGFSGEEVIYLTRVQAKRAKTVEVIEILD
jgi:hypothetical protein